MLASSNSSFAQRIFIVLAAEEPTLWGRGYNFKTGWQVTIVGHVQACSTRFLAQETSVILGKMWPNKDRGARGCWPRSVGHDP